jgi:hypothetical protein
MSGEQNITPLFTRQYSLCCCWRAPRGAAVRARARLPVAAGRLPCSGVTLRACCGGGVRARCAGGCMRSCSCAIGCGFPLRRSVTVIEDVPAQQYARKGTVIRPAWRIVCKFLDSRPSPDGSARARVLRKRSDLGAPSEQPDTVSTAESDLCQLCHLSICHQLSTHAQ